jgi:hypothetical protein
VRRTSPFPTPKSKKLKKKIPIAPKRNGKPQEANSNCGVKEFGLCSNEPTLPTPQVGKSGKRKCAQGGMRDSIPFARRQRTGTKKTLVQTTPPFPHLITLQVLNSMQGLLLIA